MKTQEKQSPLAQQIEGNWKQFKGKVQEKWGDLTNDDLDRYRGNMEQLEGAIQERTGETRQEVKKRIEEIAESLKARV